MDSAGVSNVNAGITGEAFYVQKNEVAPGQQLDQLLPKPRYEANSKRKLGGQRESRLFGYRVSPSK